MIGMNSTGFWKTGKPIPTVGLKIWLEAFEKDTLTLDVNDRVLEWRDMSGFDNHFANNATKAPLYNGTDGVDFQGNKFLLDQQSPALAGREHVQAITAFAVVETRDRAPTQVVYSAGWDSPSGADYCPFIYITSNKVYVTIREGGGGLTARNSGISNDTRFLVTLHWDGAVLSIYLNGSLVSSESTAAVDYAQFTGDAISTRVTEDRDYLNGELSALLFYTEALSNTERSAVERYLSGKYGL